MDALTPPAISFRDLDRDELLELLGEGQRRYPVPLFRVSDLLSAKWNVAQRRTEAAFAEANKAREAYLDAAHPSPAGVSMKVRAYRALMNDRHAKGLAWERARAREQRMRNAEERAWKALQACWGPR